MPIKIELTKKYLLKQRMKVVWLLSYMDYGDTQIGSIMSLDRTWVHKLLERKPKGWKPKLEELHNLE